MVVLGQCSGWLGSFCLNVSIVLHVDGVGYSTLCWLGGSFGRCRCRRCFIGELLLDLQVGVDGVHAEVEVGAVLLVVFGANVRTGFFGWGKNVGRGATLNGHDNNYDMNGNVKSCRHAKAGEIRSSHKFSFSPHFFLVIDFLRNFVKIFACKN